METPLTPLENSEKIFSPETSDQSSAEKNENVSQIYEKPQTEEIEKTETSAEAALKNSAVESPGIIEKTTGKRFEGRRVENNASNLTKRADDLETEVLEEITEIHNLSNAKP